MIGRSGEKASQDLSLSLRAFAQFRLFLFVRVSHAYHHPPSKTLHLLRGHSPKQGTFMVRLEGTVNPKSHTNQKSFDAPENIIKARLYFWSN